MNIAGGPLSLCLCECVHRNVDFCMWICMALLFKICQDERHSCGERTKESLNPNSSQILFSRLFFL